MVHASKFLLGRSGIYIPKGTDLQVQKKQTHSDSQLQTKKKHWNV